ncbi:MAG TPA: HYR domain-containing protein, partial [Phycisphaerae bacterium]|nr:HYR domain-containing protein [Phycisphaerae bacterium]HNU44206.1 HYR domain-containing protein [Phycisphaerae bacterium]
MRRVCVLFGTLLVLAVAGRVWAHPVLTLTPDAGCYNTTDHKVVTVTIALTGDKVIVGGQFFLSYDTTNLDYQSIVVGSAPFTREIYKVVNEGAGTIDYAVGVVNNTPGAMSGTMATITFWATAEVCTTANPVEFRSSGPPWTTLIDANDVFYRVPDSNLTLNNLAAITVDGTSPTISGCPGNITVSNDAGNCSAVVTWTAPTASDNCAIQSFTSNYGPGATFPVGTTTVTYTATDTCNLTATCNFDVTVNDTEAPEITTCPADRTLYVDAD